MKLATVPERPRLESGRLEESEAEDDWISLGLALSMVRVECLVALGRWTRPQGDDEPTVDLAFKLPDRQELLLIMARVNQLRRGTVTFSGERKYEKDDKGKRNKDKDDKLGSSDRKATLLEVATLEAHFVLVDSLSSKKVAARSMCLRSRYGDKWDGPLRPLAANAWIDGIHKKGGSNQVIPDYANSSLVPLFDPKRLLQVWHTAIEVDRAALRNHLRALTASAAVAKEDAEREEENYLRSSAEGWELSWGGIKAMIPDTVGVAIIAVLLSEPGRNLTWSELLQAAYSRRGDKIRKPNAKARADGAAAPIHRTSGRSSHKKGGAPNEEAFKQEAEKARLSCYHRITDALVVIATVCPPFVEHLGFLGRNQRRALVVGEGRICYSPKPNAASAHLHRDERKPITAWVLRWRGKELRIVTQNASEDVGMTAIEVLCLQQGFAFDFQYLEAVVESVRKQVRSGFSTYEEAKQSIELAREQQIAAESGDTAERLTESIRAALGAIKRNHGRSGENAATFLERAISSDWEGVILKPKLVAVTASSPFAQRKAACDPKV